MGWEDRPYYRDRGSTPSGPLNWILTGSVSLGVWFGINVRVHAAMILFIVLNVLFPGELGGFSMSVETMMILFGIVLLHEFGHCAGSRLVGGNPNQILMHPLGGLASADAPRRPWPNFITVLAGPLVNVLICLVCGVLMMALARDLAVRPWNFDGVESYFFRVGHLPPGYRLLSAIFGVSYVILLFNLLPIYPLDGGQMLQSLLWVKLGYYRSTLISSVVGMVGAVLLTGWGLINHSLLLIFIAISCGLTCLQMNRELKANGPWAYQDEDSNFSASLVGHDSSRRQKRINSRTMKRAQKLEQEAAAEQQQIDQILAKVSAKGMNSLTWFEKRALQKATERQRARDVEIGKRQRRH